MSSSINNIPDGLYFIAHPCEEDVIEIQDMVTLNEEYKHHLHIIKHVITHHKCVGGGEGGGKCDECVSWCHDMGDHIIYIHPIPFICNHKISLKYFMQKIISL